MLAQEGPQSTNVRQVSLPQSALLDFYVKNILMSKVKPQKYLLVSEQWPFLVRPAECPFKLCDSEPCFILGLFPQGLGA